MILILAYAVNHFNIKVEIKANKIHLGFRISDFAFNWKMRIAK
jgi:hypothetical protein